MEKAAELVLNFKVCRIESSGFLVPNIFLQNHLEAKVGVVARKPLADTSRRIIASEELQAVQEGKVGSLT